jgi:DNA polymerase-3 subunit beta
MTNTLNAETLANSRPVAVLDRAAFAQALAIVALAVERKNTIPVLSNLRLQGTGESLVLTGTDLDSEITFTLPGAADSRLAITAPAHMLSDILKKAKASELASMDHAADFDRDSCSLAVDMGGVRFSLNAIPAEDFPVMPAAVGASFSLPMAELLTAIERCRFAVSTEETRYYLNGIYFHPRRAERGGPVTFRAVATDGHRLAYFDMTGGPINGRAFGQAFKAAGGFIVPRLALEKVTKAAGILAKAKALPESVAVTVGRNMIRLAFGPVQITAKLIDGTFPDYMRVVPRYNENVSTFAVKDMAEAVTQVSLISAEKGRAVRLDVRPDSICLTVNNPGNGRAETTIPATLAGEPLEIGFNARYLTDLLAEITGETVTAAFSDAGSPAVFSDPADSRFAAVLMPMRV